MENKINAAITSYRVLITNLCSKDNSVIEGRQAQIMLLGELTRPVLMFFRHYECHRDVIVKSI